VCGDYFNGYKIKKKENELSQEVTTWETDTNSDTNKSIVQPNYITPWCKVLPEKITCPQLAKRFSAFYGTRRFITTFTSVLHVSPSPS
jgi:hypothetical protein